GTGQETFQAEDDREAEAQDGHEDPGEADDLDREQRESRQEIEVQSEQAEETVAGAAVLARTVVDRHLGDRRREGVGERRDEMRPAVAGEHPVHDRAPISPEHAPVVAHPHPDDGRGPPAHDPRREPTAPRTAAPHPPPPHPAHTVPPRRPPPPPPLAPPPPPRAAP